MVQAAKDIVAALKDQPALLTLSIANLALLAFIYYALHDAAEFRHRMLEQISACVAATQK